MSILAFSHLYLLLPPLSSPPPCSSLLPLIVLTLFLCYLPLSAYGLGHNSPLSFYISAWPTSVFLDTTQCSLSALPLRETHALLKSHSVSLPGVILFPLLFLNTSLSTGEWFVCFCSLSFCGFVCTTFCQVSGAGPLHCR